MNFVLTRSQYGLYGIFGEMKSEDGSAHFATLEHAYAGAQGWVPKVAPGTYTCRRRRSPHFGYEVFVLQDVPDFRGNPVNYIEIHIGNYTDDSDGCILVGLKKGTGMIEDSRKAFELFMELQNGMDSFLLIIK